MRSVESGNPVLSTEESAIPREVEVIYSGEDGHIYISEGDGRRAHRLTWSLDDFSTLPGMPALPGVCGPLEDSLVFTNPVPSRDGQRVAVFGLLPTRLDDRELYPWEPWMGEEGEDDEWEVVQADAPGADGESSDVVGRALSYASTAAAATAGSALQRTFKV